MLKTGLELLTVKKKHGKLQFRDFGGFCMRNISMKKIFKEALSDKTIPDFPTVLINTGDIPFDKRIEVNIFAFSTASGYYDKVIPDFVYDCWKECKIPAFDKITSSLVSTGKKKADMKKVGWIGNYNTSTIRLVLAKLGQEFPEYLDIRNSNDKNTKRMSLEELVETYKFLIDVEGVGYSGRTKLLFFSGRPLFIQERKRQDFALQSAVPYEHYIPVKNDLSDLIEQVKLVVDDEKLAKKIGKGGQEFALKKLTKKEAYIYLQKQFTNIKTISFNDLKIRGCIWIRFLQKVVDVCCNILYRYYSRKGTKK